MASPTRAAGGFRGGQPDWTAPWFLPWAKQGGAALESVRVAGDAAGAVAAALNTHAGSAVPVRFVPASEMPAGSAYETFIARERAVPTRDNAHDFFNGLAWLRLPRAKARLNAIRAAAIARDGVGGARGPVRDAATLFDENALLLHAPDALWNALQARRWQAAFGALRPLWSQAAALVFGHAALEKLLHPYRAITCHVWRVAPAFDPADDLAALDAWLARDLTPAKLAAKPFAALPLLGIPGWCAANRDPDFYDDAAVFRAPRG